MSAAAAAGGTSRPARRRICGNAVRENGEPDRIRTCDLLIKSQLLYQLSYGPAHSAPDPESAGPKRQ